jgi:hypothetical protein
MSNAERIARAAAEAAATAREKEEKAKARKAKKASAPKRTLKKAEPEHTGRMKLVWGVGKYGAPPVATFPYSQKAEAEAEAKRLGNCIVKPLKVPLE